MNLHRLMLIVILLAGFGLGLSLPAYRRHMDERHAQQAVEMAQALVQAEKQFFEQHGFYTADFGGLMPQLPCHQTVQNGQSTWICRGYTIVMEEAQQLRIASVKYPQWFTVLLDSGAMACEYEEGSAVGQKLCASARVPNYI